MRLAERVIKRAVKIDDAPLTVDDILDTVCRHYNVSATAINSKSRKRELVTARQVSMYLAQKYTKMPRAVSENWLAEETIPPLSIVVQVGKQTEGRWDVLCRYREHREFFQTKEIKI